MSFSTLTDAAADGLTRATDRAADGLTRASDRAADRLTSAADRVSDGLSSAASRTIGRNSTIVVRLIRDHPLQSVAGALIVGALASSIVTRRR